MNGNTRDVTAGQASPVSDTLGRASPASLQVVSIATVLRFACFRL
jgi:hypothetical protein